MVLGVALAAAYSLGAAVPMALNAAAKSGGPTISASVVQTNPGPLLACSAGPCPSDTLTDLVVFVRNRNPLNNSAFQFGIGSTARNQLVGAFVVTSIDESATVNGSPYPGGPIVVPITPPPSVAPPNAVWGWSGHWPATVTCTSSGPPCDVVTSPAAIPGEKVAIFYDGWAHGATEPNGTYVFTFVLHGTVDGSPLDITVSGKPIKMVPKRG
jgi:hypothetical protein